MNAPAPATRDSGFPLRDADLCVKCGLCLPHCPTYGLSGHEGDSPRGRIALMQGLVSGVLQVSPKLEAHLDGCLSCRACEPVCPAKVPYGKLIDAGRAELRGRRPGGAVAARIAGTLLASRPLRNLLGALLWLYQRLQVSRALRGTPGRWFTGTRLGRAEALLPRLTWPRTIEQAIGENAPKVLLFTGCTGQWLDGAALRDTVKVLNRIGYHVGIPRDQACCGALQQHAGLVKDAATTAARNLRAFGGELPVLSFASGCGATLLDYAHLLEQGGRFAARVQDVSAFVLACWPEDLALKALPARVAVHTACTLKNVMKADRAQGALLRKIPQAELVELDPAQHCCGAAGSYMLTQPQAADALRDRKLDALARLKPDYLVSGNIGCSMHLAAGLRQRGIAMEVLHPMSLLARCLS